MRSIIGRGCVLTTVLLLSFFCACSKKKSEETLPPVKETFLKVMTYNVHHCNPPAKVETDIDMEAIANVIKTESPDLVALQEIDVNTTRSGITLDQAKELGRLTGMSYYFAKALDYKGGAYGVAILSRFPILESDKQLLPKKEGIAGEQRVIAWVTVEMPNKKKLVFASTHFDLADHRLVQAQKVQEIFKDLTLPLIFGGDFNEGPGAPAINYLDTYFTRSCPKVCLNTIPTDIPTKAIDLIFYKPKTAFEVVKSYTIPEQKASDHLPLVVNFKIK